VNKELQGVTPVRPDRTLPSDKNSLIVFTEAYLRCPCRPGDLQKINDFGKSIICHKCKEIYEIPEVSYRWPPKRKKI